MVAVTVVIGGKIEVALAIADVIRTTRVMVIGATGKGSAAVIGIGTGRLTYYTPDADPE